jgi:alkylation response protein AidB-like acyl-CoA dehydrogenase
MAATAPQAAALPDDLNLMGDEDFRLMLREWIAANYPPHKRYVSGRLTFDQISDWFMALSRKGWLAPQWPREYGGMGLSPGKYLIYVEEMARHGCARIPDHGIGLIGPLLI